MNAIRSAARTVPAVRVPLATIRPDQRFRDDFGMWHIAASRPEATTYRGSDALTVETSTGRRLYATPDTLVVLDGTR